jgi:ribose transport system substrate-binding protein
MLKRGLALAAALALCTVSAAACGDDDSGGGGGGGRASEEIVIGWTPPDITGVFKTATNFFEKAAADANAAGFNVKVESRSPATHTSFADQLAII